MLWKKIVLNVRLSRGLNGNMLYMPSYSIRSYISFPFNPRYVVLKSIQWFVFLNDRSSFCFKHCLYSG